MATLHVWLDEKTNREPSQLVEELGGSAAEAVGKAIHLAWFTVMQERMRRESAEIANDPAEQEEAARVREWVRYLVS